MLQNLISFGFQRFHFIDICICLCIGTYILMFVYIWIYVKYIHYVIPLLLSGKTYCVLQENLKTMPSNNNGKN